ncbi:hypothetical protein SteCoe_23175 [Stentor coeruleus]|uniref:Tubulin--tyrosine ligase-like protein 9 n=1 Tax=Stentor coeruleus TaxID=5963 RepID=A0A1R2BKI0_9CILI|nr:hypothetical protein SteCoe_24711 [Stentor coeruleus]OMJ77266.1 hypothetical protein SteCoe_23175 [Stentor coeruleus]
MEEGVITKKRPRIVCNVGDTKYEVVKHVAAKCLGWHLTDDFLDDNWDIEWTDNSVSPDKLSKMRQYQKINHFPGMYGICKKNYLAWNLNRMCKLFPNDYNFYPKTWVLPGDWIDLKSSWTKNKFFIFKPEASSQGRGIFLKNKLEDINLNERFVAQEYLKDPLLIDGLKFDLRIYVLLAGCNPLRVYIHDQGLVRLATEGFSPPNIHNMNNMCMHLTNYAVNKNNSKFVFNEDSDADDIGHKRSLSSTLSYLQEQGYDIEALMKSIEDIIMKTLCSVQPYLAHLYKSCQPEDYSNSMCFELLGFDVILDKNLKPWVLEVNHSPSFSTDSPLDWKVKKKIIKDSLELLGVMAKNRKKYFLERKAGAMKRALTGKNIKETKEQREEMMAIAQSERDKWENSHLGGFRKLYPCEDEKYEVFIKGANDIYTELTGTNKNRLRKPSESSQPINLPKPAKNSIFKSASPTVIVNKNPNKTSVIFPDINLDRYLPHLLTEDPLYKNDISPITALKKDPQTKNKHENILIRSAKADTLARPDILETYENRLSLVQHIQEAIYRSNTKYKMLETPVLQIHSIKLNMPPIKHHEPDFFNGKNMKKIIIPTKIRFPDGVFLQERKTLNQKIV